MKNLEIHGFHLLFDSTEVESAFSHFRDTTIESTPLIIV